MPAARARRPASSSCPASSIRALLAPRMPVRGVRRSWEMARSRSPPHPLPGSRRAHLFLLLHLAGHGGGGQGYGQQGDEGEGITRYGEIEGHVGVDEHVIHQKHAGHRGQDAVQIAAGKPGRHQHGQHEHHKDVDVPVGPQANEQAKPYGRPQKRQGQQEIPKGMLSHQLCQRQFSQKSSPISYFSTPGDLDVVNIPRKNAGPFPARSAKPRTETVEKAGRF